MADESTNASLIFGYDTYADPPIASPECTDIFCYNTATSGQSLVTGLYVDAILGLLFYCLFLVFFNKFPLYRARLQMPGVIFRPPALDASGFRRVWAWLGPVFTTRDVDLLRGTSLDSLAGTRVLAFGVLLMLPMTILGIGMLLPINFTASSKPSTGDLDAVFLGMTMSNVPRGSDRFWAHFAFVYFVVAWSSFLLRKFHRDHVSAVLRAEFGPGPGAAHRQAALPGLVGVGGIGPEPSLEFEEMRAAAEATSSKPTRPTATDPLDELVATGPSSGVIASFTTSKRGPGAVAPPRPTSFPSPRWTAGSPASPRTTELLRSAFPGGAKSPDDEVFIAPGQPSPSPQTADATAAARFGALAWGDGARTRAASPPAPPPVPAPGGAASSDRDPAWSRDWRATSGAGAWRDAEARAPTAGAPREVPGPRDIQAVAGVPAPPHPGRYAVLILDQAEQTYVFGGHGAMPGASVLGIARRAPSLGGTKAKAAAHARRTVRDGQLSETFARQASAGGEADPGVPAGRPGAAPPAASLSPVDWTADGDDGGDDADEGRAPAGRGNGSGDDAAPRRRAPTLQSPKLRTLSRHVGESRRMAAARAAYEEVFGDDFIGLVPAAPSQRVDSLLSKQYSLRASWQRAAADARKALADAVSEDGDHKAEATARAIGNLELGAVRSAEAEAAAALGMSTSGAHPPARRGSGTTGAGGTSAAATGGSGAAAAEPGAALADAIIGTSWQPRSRAERRALKAARRADALAEKLAKVRERIETAREDARSARPPGPFFALFRTQAAATYAASVNVNPPNRNLMKAFPAPDPASINWSTLTRGWRAREARPVLLIPLVLAIMLFPMGIFSGGFTQLTTAICHKVGTQEARSAAARGFCSDTNWARFLRGLLTGVVPSLLLSIYQAVVLPTVFYLIVLGGAQAISHEDVEDRIGHYLFLWVVLNQFAGAVLGGSIISGIRTFVNSPAKIWRLLGSAVPASSNFFVLYVVFRAFAMLPFRLFWPCLSVLADLLRWARLLRPASAPYDRLWTRPPRNQRLSYDVGLVVMSITVPVLAYAPITPFILPFGLVYFCVMWCVWRYQSLYVFEPAYDARGRIWPFFAHRFVACLMIQVVFTSAMLIVKGAYIQAGVMLPTLSVYLIAFSRYLHRFDAVAESQPLWSKHEAPPADIDPDLFTPVPLRTDYEECWHPGWGKAWQYWAVPRYGF